METVKLIAVILAGLSAVLYAYQFAFIPLQWILSARKKKRDAALFFRTAEDLRRADFRPK